MIQYCVLLRKECDYSDCMGCHNDPIKTNVPCPYLTSEGSKESDNQK